MNNEVYKEVYGHILNDSQRIRKEIMNEWGDTLMFGGSMPQEAIDELSTAARITGLSFDALAKHGVNISQVNGKPDLYSLSVRDETYVCHKSAIPSMVGFLDVVNIPGVSVEQPAQKAESPVIEKSSSAYTQPDKEEELEQESPRVERDTRRRYFEEEPEPVEEDFFPDEESEEEVETEPEVEEKKEPESEEEDSPEEEVLEAESEPESEQETVLEAPKLRAEVIGGSPNIGYLNRDSLFIEERSKNVDEIIYEMFDVSLTHSGYGGGGKATEMQIMVAPLKIQKFACPSVPILVSVYCNGKVQSFSSYELKEDGKNLVQLCINEFYLLFRGSYDAAGHFKALVTTTGISANQGDIMNVTSATKYGDDSNKNVNNGHVKFKSLVYGEPGTIEVIPFGAPDDNEFIVLTKTDEFVDYIYVSDIQGGMKKPTIFTEENKKNLICCSWEGDQMKVELKEA